MDSNSLLCLREEGYKRFVVNTDGMENFCFEVFVLLAFD